MESLISGYLEGWDRDLVARSEQIGGHGGNGRYLQVGGGKTARDQFWTKKEVRKMALEHA